MRRAYSDGRKLHDEWRYIKGCDILVAYFRREVSGLHPEDADAARPLLPLTST
jgi:hypothetical protein